MPAFDLPNIDVPIRLCRGPGAYRDRAGCWMAAISFYEGTSEIVYDPGDRGKAGEPQWDWSTEPRSVDSWIRSCCIMVNDRCLRDNGKLPGTRVDAAGECELIEHQKIRGDLLAPVLFLPLGTAGDSRRWPRWYQMLRLALEAYPPFRGVAGDLVDGFGVPVTPLESESGGELLGVFYKAIGAKIREQPGPLSGTAEIELYNARSVQLTKKYVLPAIRDICLDAGNTPVEPGRSVDEVRQFLTLEPTTGD